MNERKAEDRSAWIPLVALIVLLLPAMLLSYLPMTDIPQHLAIASIIEHIDDPAYGFSDYYEIALSRTLYLLPYGVVLAAGQVVSLETGMRFVVLLSMALYPLGVIACLRAMGKPAWLALLCLPLLYNRAWFMGFVNLNLAIALSLFAWALLLRKQREWKADLAIALLSILIVLTHGYGVGMLIGFALLTLIFGERKGWMRRFIPILPAVVGAGLWAWLARGAGEGRLVFMPLSGRLIHLEHSILGGYRGPGELAILILLLITTALFLGSNSLRRGAWTSLPPDERTLRAFILVNFLLYFVMPTHTATITIIHFRHALIAALVLPLIATTGCTGSRPRLRRLLLGVLVVATLVNTWVHLIRFDREARTFDRLVEKLPRGSRIVALNWDPRGEIMRTKPYLHFATYAQARKGGHVADNFAATFWNVPIRLRDDVPIPPNPPRAGVRPRTFDYHGFGYFYDHVIVRRGAVAGPERFEYFPYERIFAEPPWELYRAVAGDRMVADRTGMQSGKIANP